MPLDLNSLDDAEKFQKHFVEPVVAAVRTEVRNVLDETKKELAALKAKDTEQDEEIRKLKENERKALLGYGVLSLGISTLVGLAWGGLRNWVSKHFGV